MIVEIIAATATKIVVAVSAALISNKMIEAGKKKKFVFV